MRILFVGNFSLGSDARGFKDALARREDVEVDEIDLDGFLPIINDLRLRIAYRFLRRFQVEALERELLSRIEATRPDAVIVFKGLLFTPGLVSRMKATGTPLVNLYPDYSPRAYGKDLAETMGLYDLVMSTKAHHPGLWQSRYGYSNRCVHVSHGYNPDLHLVTRLPENPDYDVVMVASGRPEYVTLLQDLAARSKDRPLRVAVGGVRWDKVAPEMPAHWDFVGEQWGRSYTDWLRRGHIVLAPVQLTYVHDGKSYPADQVTARTFQCPAAHVFFIHPRTDEVQTLFDEETEVPLFSDPGELADKVMHYIDRPEERAAMAAAAHARAVPAYSHDARAAEIVAHLTGLSAARD